MKGLDKSLGLEVAFHLEGFASLLGRVLCCAVSCVDCPRDRLDAFATAKVGSAQRERLDLLVLRSSLASNGKRLVVGLSIISCLGNGFEGLFDGFLVAADDNGSCLCVAGCLATALLHRLAHAFYATFATKMHPGKRHLGVRSDQQTS